MKQEHMEKIKSYYDKQGEYQRNERYSGEQGIVYTKTDDNVHWLVMEQKGENGIEVRQTDSTGRITARDTYESVGNTIRCTEVMRKKADSKEMITFRPYELHLLGQFGEDSLQETIDRLKAVEPAISDEMAKKMVRNTIHKISTLSEESGTGLITSTKNRKEANKGRSIRKRLADAEKRIKEQKNMEKNKSPRFKKISRTL